uniref:F-box domain-containing protein n=1 Tax=Globodera pallida TaxID=36090 RepID=A0A183C4C6_GLOPA
MSDNASGEEQQQQMQEIYICADVWLEVFAFVSPLELGHLVALISDRFDALVDEHFKLRKWSLDWIEIRRATDRNGAEIRKPTGVRLPIPQGPIPNKVIGFKELWISYVDQTVIEFLQRIRRLFDSSGTNVEINTWNYANRSWEIIRQKIWPFVNDNICGLFLCDSQCDRLRQLSPAILRNCGNLRSIHSYRHFPEFPAEDNADASSRQAVANWLLTARGDGLPKMFRDYFPTGMEGLKGSFVNASEPVNFFIRLYSPSGIEPFELKNTLGERLTLRHFGKYDRLMLVRCPIVREEDQWAKWEEEAIEWEWFCQWNRIIINIKDRDIGAGMIDENEGPSEPKK